MSTPAPAGSGPASPAASAGSAASSSYLPVLLFGCAILVIPTPADRLGFYAVLGQMAVMTRLPDAVGDRKPWATAGIAALYLGRMVAQVRTADVTHRQVVELITAGVSGDLGLRR